MQHTLALVLALAIGAVAAPAAAQPAAKPAPAPAAGATHLVVFNRLGPNAARMNELREAALAHRQLYVRLADEGKLIAGGRMSGEPVLGLSVFASNVDKAQVRALLENDPAVKAGIVEIEFREWQLQMGSLAGAEAR